MYEFNMNYMTETQYNALKEKAKSVGRINHFDGGVTLIKGIYGCCLDGVTMDEIYEITDEVYSRKWVQNFIKEIA